MKTLVHERIASNFQRHLLLAAGSDPSSLLRAHWRRSFRDCGVCLGRCGVTCRDATFWSKQNLQTISVQNAFVAICALGMLLIMIAGASICRRVLRWRYVLALSHGACAKMSGSSLRTAKTCLGGKRLKAADDAINLAQRKNDAPEIENSRKNLAGGQRLAELLQIKLDQLQSKLENTDEPQRTELQDELAIAHRAIGVVKELSTAIEADLIGCGYCPMRRVGLACAVDGVGCGMLCGLLNGLLIVVLRVIPFIATWHNDNLFGLAKLVADETAVRPGTAQVPVGWGTCRGAARTGLAVGSKVYGWL